MSRTDKAPAEQVGEGLGHDPSGSGPSCATERSRSVSDRATPGTFFDPVTEQRVTNDADAPPRGQPRHVDALRAAGAFLHTHLLPPVAATHIEAHQPGETHIRFQLRHDLSTLLAFADALEQPILTARRSATTTHLAVTGSIDEHPATAWSLFDDATEHARTVWHALDTLPAVGTDCALPVESLRTAIEGQQP